MDSSTSDVGIQERNDSVSGMEGDVGVQERNGSTSDTEHDVEIHERNGATADMEGNYSIVLLSDEELTYSLEAVFISISSYPLTDVLIVVTFLSNFSFLDNFSP